MYTIRNGYSYKVKYLNINLFSKHSVSMKFLLVVQLTIGNAIYRTCIAYTESEIIEVM